MSDGWHDQLAGARMQVDQQFSDRVRNSQFSNQQWGLIMTAVEFDIENAGDPTEAQLVADTEKVEQILPEIENVPQGMGAGQPPQQRGSGGGGLLDSLKDYLPGGSDGPDEGTLEAATALADEYAAELQSHLEDHGRWDEIRERAAEQG